MYVGKTVDHDLRSYRKSDHETTDQRREQRGKDKMTYNTTTTTDGGGGEQQQLQLRQHQQPQSNCNLEGGGRASAAARRLGTVIRMEDVQGNDYGEDQGDGNHEGGFGYSQKFFHISDGNLYSVFSPLQGRSYGVKPSFLRKHRCTLQETKGKKGGRRNARRGLKFHNFIPSESITSEREEAQPGQPGQGQGQPGQRKHANKDNKNQTNPGTSEDPSQQQSTSGEVWKVHAECRLREEHGTKQIMVSNWSLSSDSPALPSNSKTTNVQASHKTSHRKETESPMEISAPVIQPKVEVTSQKERNLRSKCCTITTTTTTEPSQPSQPSQTTKDEKLNYKTSVLQQYLEYGKMLPDSEDCSMTSIEDKVKQELQLEYLLEGEDGKKRRRKPTTTRRVVPYTKYLTMMDDGPLDLSCQKDKDGGEEELLFTSLNLQRIVPSETDRNNTSLPNNSEHHPEMYLNLTQCLSNKYQGSNMTEQPSLFDMSPGSSQGININNIGVNYGGDTSYGKLEITPNTNHPSTSSFVPQHIANGPHLPQGYMSLQGPQHQNQLHRMIQPNQEETARPRRKPSQRTIIRQKLEDTFKQNGFLVKTKQVSDGDATFCKFKQLRKYTRYYLKSWHQHLPDEVHKLWKGFLPPKTPLNNHQSKSGGNQEPETTAMPSTVQIKNSEIVQ